MLLITPFAPEQDARANRLCSFVRNEGVKCVIVGISDAKDSSGIGKRPEDPPRFSRRIVGRLVRYRNAWKALRFAGDRSAHVVAVNCEVALVAWLYRMTHRGTFRLTIDVYDHHGYVFESWVLSKVFAILELLSILLADDAILPIADRLAQYPKFARSLIARKTVFISNAGFAAPDFDGVAVKDIEAAATGIQAGSRNERLRIVYCGNVDYSRGIGVLIEAVVAMGGTVELTIFGSGVALDHFRNQGREALVRFKGAFSNAELPSLAHGYDLFWAVYDLRIQNNRFCDPNKFRDHILADVPILTNPGHPLADLVSESGSGFVVDLNEEALRQFFMSTDGQSLRARRPSVVGATRVMASVISDNRRSGLALIGAKQ